MAKVTTPLLSFTARGQIGQTLVFFPWKGIDAVRSYVRPANPNTGAQQTQRGYLTASVTAWHSANLTPSDRAAWNRRASTEPTPMSGFNSFCKHLIAELVQLDLHILMWAGAIADLGAGAFSATVTEDGDATGVTMYWGYSPTSLINSVALSEVANVWTDATTPATPNATIYAKFVGVGAGGAGGETGIYSLSLGA